jgi:hypothetical protein
MREIVEIQESADRWGGSQAVNEFSMRDVEVQAGCGDGSPG